MSDFLAQLDELQHAGLAALNDAASPDAVEAWRIAYLGSKGKLKSAMAGMKDVPKDDKPAAGQKANEVKVVLEQAFAAKKHAA